MQLIENWKDAWKMRSVQVFGLIAAAPLLWAQVPEDVKALIPVEWQPYVVSAMALIGAFARIKKQHNL